MDAGTYAWIVIVIFFIIFTSVCVSLDKMVMFTKKPFFSVFYFFRFFLSFLCFFDFSSETNFILKSVFSFQLSSKSQFDHYFLVGRKIDFFFLNFSGCCLNSCTFHMRIFRAGTVFQLKNSKKTCFHVIIIRVFHL